MRPTLQEFDNVLGLILGGLFLVRYMVPFLAPLIRRWQERRLAPQDEKSIPRPPKGPG
ncbi:MAG: hypothetical protein QJR13_09535 [Bacillota bacterium]|nr:hypothetical protein [Bacillota bacterium]